MTLLPSLFPVNRWLEGRFPAFDSAQFPELLDSTSIRYGEDSDHYFVQVDLPGVRKEDLKLSVQEGELRLSAERTVGVGASAHKTSISRSFTLPDDVNVDKISAEQKDGVLTLTLQKKEEAKPKVLQIDVK